MSTELKLRIPGGLFARLVQASAETGAAEAEIVRRCLRKAAKAPARVAAGEYWEPATRRASVVLTVRAVEERWLAALNSQAMLAALDSYLAEYERQRATRRPLELEPTPQGVVVVSEQ